jgi:hypothetical protein
MLHQKIGLPISSTVPLWVGKCRLGGATRHAVATQVSMVRAADVRCESPPNFPIHPAVQSAQAGQVVLADEEDCLLECELPEPVMLKCAGYGAATIGNHADFILDWPNLVGRVLLNLKP